MRHLPTRKYLAIEREISNMVTGYRAYLEDDHSNPNCVFRLHTDVLVCARLSKTHLTLIYRRMSLSLLIHSLTLTM